MEEEASTSHLGTRDGITAGCEEIWGSQQILRRITLCALLVYSDKE